MKQLGFFDLPDHLKQLSDAGDPLSDLGRIIDFEGFRPVLDIALDYSDGARGGRPSYDPVAMYKVLVLAARNNVSDKRMEFLIRDRLSWLRFLGFDLGKPTPDENTIRSFHERLTDAAKHDGKVLRRIVTRDNTACDVWADTAYRSKANEAFLEKHGRVSRIHFKKPTGKPMADNIARGNAAKSKVRARVVHVFGEQKNRMGLFIRTIGITRAETKITLVNLAYNMKRLIFHERRATTA